MNRHKKWSVQPNTGWFDEDGEWKDRYRDVNGQTYDTLADKRGPGESRVAYLQGEPIASARRRNPPIQGQAPPLPELEQTSSP